MLKKSVHLTIFPSVMDARRTTSTHSGVPKLAIRKEHFCVSRWISFPAFCLTPKAGKWPFPLSCTSGLHNSESSKGQIDQQKLAARRKSLFRHSVEEILKGQVIIPSRAFATFSATEFSRAARKDLAGRMWPAGRMLCRPAVHRPQPCENFS